MTTNPNQNRVILLLRIAKSVGILLFTAPVALLLILLNFVIDVIVIVLRAIMFLMATCLLLPANVLFYFSIGKVAKMHNQNE